MPAYDTSLFNPSAPLARVTIRHPTSGAMVSDMAMLLDTGADITLLPQAFIE
jgi:predicted aspartyl protease